MEIILFSKYINKKNKFIFKIKYNEYTKINIILDDISSLFRYIYKISKNKDKSSFEYKIYNFLMKNVCKINLKNSYINKGTDETILCEKLNKLDINKNNIFQRIL